MKYKNICAAIHNLGHSFVGLTNYVDDGYVVDDLWGIIGGGHDITIDWLNRTFIPESQITPRIQKSIDFYAAGLSDQLRSQDVDPACIKALEFHWPARGRRYMRAVDDHGKDHKIYVAETK
jgi:hypothetical protein